MIVFMVFMVVIAVITLIVVMVLMVEMRVIVKVMMVITLELVKPLVTVNQGVTEKIMPWPRDMINDKGGLYLSVVGGLGYRWGMGQLRSHSLQCCSLGSH